MKNLSDTIEFAQKLIIKKSVTPKDDGAIKTLKSKLSKMGFINTELPFGSKKNNDLILNLFSINKSAHPKHKTLCFAGHTDVVPEGNTKNWKFDPFLGKVSNGKLHGRGASDMKGAIAAWVIACRNALKKKKLNISLALLITGDEEGVAINGTIKVVKWLKQKKINIDYCVVGEPTNPNYIGEMIKVGRRGSLSFSLEVLGKSGHVAYPHLAKNPVSSLINVCNQLNNLKLNLKAKNFPLTNLEVTSIDTGNPTSNVIPSTCKALINIRYNTRYNEKILVKKIKDIFLKEPCSFRLEIISSNKPFYTKADKFLSLLEKSIYKVTKKKPALSTTGGTSDARFIKDICPVYEFGSVGKTMHQINENINIRDLESLQKIYEELILSYNDLCS
ncbi:MAG: succinyl-diaminopimelate desuccinylase [Rhodobacteraceae bacterium]|nr:succinyl-diaminopimelate desuccinylase [Paracoccaceae bacterium]OUU62554.1 MAG: succinyl-diaminopimelate desuccinylase [Alphaproteobacteria bacterium TMED62]|tara:strand:- start:3286 stop:4452 length:1167 start_codon:yes stop_codon:yes gene_type:complete